MNNTQNDLYKYTFINENNEEEEYEILLTFKSDKYNKIFFIMTDNSLGENKKLNTYAFYLNNTDSEVDNPDPVLNPVTNDEELDFVNKVFNNVEREIK